jgi:hypothetical protein
MNILFLSATTEEPFERTMIADILIHGNKGKVTPLSTQYASYLHEDLQQVSSRNRELVDEEK